MFIFSVTNPHSHSNSSNTAARKQPQRTKRGAPSDIASSRQQLILHAWSTFLEHASDNLRARLTAGLTFDNPLAPTCKSLNQVLGRDFNVALIRECQFNLMVFRLHLSLLFCRRECRVEQHGICLLDFRLSMDEIDARKNPLAPPSTPLLTSNNQDQDTLAPGMDEFRSMCSYIITCHHLRSWVTGSDRACLRECERRLKYLLIWTEVECDCELMDFTFECLRTNLPATTNSDDAAVISWTVECLHEVNVHLTLFNPVILSNPDNNVMEIKRNAHSASSQSIVSVSDVDGHSTPTSQLNDEKLNANSPASHSQPPPPLPPSNAPFTEINADAAPTRHSMIIFLHQTLSNDLHSLGDRHLEERLNHVSCRVLFDPLFVRYTSR